MTMNLKWRLGKLPTVEELLSLINNKLITQEEAKTLLFSSEKETDVKSLEEEIKFLRGLVEQLSKNNSSRIVEVIREVEKPWRRYPWYNPYVVWCTNTEGSATTSGSVIYTSGAGATNAFNTNTSGSIESNKAFSSIKTF